MCTIIYKVCGYNRSTCYFTKSKFFASLADAMEEALSQVFVKKHTHKTAKNETMLIYEVKGDDEKVIVECPCFPKQAPKKRGRKRGSRLMRD